MAFKNDHIRIHFTMYGYLKMLTILEAAEQGILIPTEMQKDVTGLLQLLRSFPISSEGPN